MKSFDHGGNLFAVARSLGIQPDALLDFSASINPLGLAPGVRQALEHALDRLCHYPDSEATDLRRALASFHGLDEASICIGNGSTELIYLLPRLIPGRRGLIVAPAFSEYARALARQGWQTDYFTLNPDDNFTLSFPPLKDRLSEGYDALFLCNPGNPAGNLLPLPVIEQIYRFCRERRVFMVLDEAFVDFCEAGSAKGLMLGGDGVVLRSMTKFYAMPGLRLGYAVGSPGVIDRLQSLREPWSVNTPAQLAGLAALADDDYRERTLKVIDEERAYLAGRIDALGGLKAYGSAANYLLVRIVSGPTAAVLRERMLERGILIRDCSTFQGLDERFFRVAVRGREENSVLVRQLANSLHGHARRVASAGR